MWRVVMLAGSLLPLTVAVTNALREPNLSQWITRGSIFCGYAAVAVGFALAMRARRRS